MPAKDHAAWDILLADMKQPSRMMPVRADEARPFAIDRTRILQPTADPLSIREDFERRTKDIEPMKVPLSEKLVALCWIPYLAAILAAISYGGNPFANPVYWVGLLLGASEYLVYSKIRRYRTTVNRFLKRRCPDCNYDLSASHADPPLDPQTLGINLGPRHCPECGALWPLVPPPVPTPPTP